MRALATLALVAAIAAVGWWWRDELPPTTVADNAPQPAAARPAVAPPDTAWTDLFDSLANDWKEKGGKR